MTYSFGRLSCATAALTLLAHGVAADVTPAEVWADMKAQIEHQGYTITATETASDDSLSLSDLEIVMSGDAEDSDVGIALPELVLTDMGDGTVKVELPASFPFSVSGPIEEGKTFTISFNVSQTAPSLVVSGDPSAITYDYAAETLDVELGEISTKPDEMPADSKATGSFQLKDVRSVSVSTTGPVRTLAQEFTAAEMTYGLDVVLPEDEGTAKLKGAVESVAVKSASDFPSETDATMATAPVELLKAGFAVGTTATFAKNSMQLDGTGEGNTFSLSASSDAGTYSLGMDMDSFLVDVATEGSKISVTADKLPFPLAADVDTAAFGMEMPVLKSDDPQSYGMTLAISDFAVSEDIWKLIDPTGGLPHDPVTAAMNVSGLMTLLEDVLDPSDMMGDTPPAELQELSLNSLLLQAAGAQLFAQGAATFDNSDTTTFPGYPRPTGKINVELKGGNGLLDRLIQMGLVEEQMAQGARMMMAMFAVPQGDDTLTSELEITEQGQILANGQRLK